MKNKKYYYLSDVDIVAKEENKISYIYKDKQWQLDNNHLLWDRLMDYGDCSIMDVDEITEEEAMRLIG